MKWLSKFLNKLKQLKKGNDKRYSSQKSSYTFDDKKNKFYDGKNYR